MATEIKMPQLSDTMNSGKILAWRKKEGDQVKRGEILAEVETDKANLEIECFQPGTLLMVLVPAGSTANVGEAICVMGNPGENVAADRKPAPQAPAKSEDPPAPSRETVSTPPHSSPTPPDNRVQHEPAPEETHGSSRLRISPLARRLAAEQGLDPAKLHGTGPQGRIVKKDIEAAKSAGAGGFRGSAAVSTAPTYSRTAAAPEQERNLQPAPQAAPQPHGQSIPVTGAVAGRLYPFSKMRETIARRMQESVATSPHFYVTSSINMDQAVKLREVLKGDPNFKGISLNHLVIKAAAYALQNEPQVNRSVRDNQIFEPDQINIGIITAIEDGLLIPVIRSANTLSLKDIVFEANAGIERARAGRPNSSDLSGGTFSISNMGMYDVENFTAIINPGQGAVLSVSSVKDEAVVYQGQIIASKRMKVTLSVDHRIIDGLMGANFLKFFKQALEIPALLMV